MKLDLGEGRTAVVDSERGLMDLYVNESWIDQLSIFPVFSGTMTPAEARKKAMESARKAFTERGWPDPGPSA